MRRPRVVLADDHIMIAEAFEKLLAPSCDIVGKVGDGRALLAAVRELHPDVVVVDIGMPLLNGLTAARQIRELDPDDQAGVPDDERGPGPGRGSLPGRRLGLPAEAVGRLRAADGDPAGDAAPIRT